MLHRHSVFLWYFMYYLWQVMFVFYLCSDRILFKKKYILNKWVNKKYSWAIMCMWTWRNNDAGVWLPEAGVTVVRWGTLFLQELNILDGSILKDQRILDYDSWISLVICPLRYCNWSNRILPGCFPWHPNIGSFHTKILLNNASLCLPLHV